MRFVCLHLLMFISWFRLLHFSSFGRFFTIKPQQSLFQVTKKKESGVMLIPSWCLDSHEKSWYFMFSVTFKCFKCSCIHTYIVDMEELWFYIKFSTPLIFPAKIMWGKPSVTPAYAHTAQVIQLHIFTIIFKWSSLTDEPHSRWMQLYWQPISSLFDTESLYCFDVIGSQLAGTKTENR